MSGYILWHQDNSGESQFWFMDKEMISRRATALFENSAPALVGPPFRIVGTHRGNILWHNDQSHETQFWFMNNERIVQRATAVDETGAKIFIAPPFHIVGFADFNGDNNSDILWFNDVSHETQIWFMNRERIVRRETVIDEKGAKIFIGPPFRIVGGADFDGNGNADILWYNSESGETQIWFMNKHQIVRRGTALFENKSAALIHPPFRIVGTADTDMNGKSEIIWHQDVSHDTVLWFMDGEQIVRRPAVIDEHGKVIDIAPPFHVVGGGATAVDPLLATKLIREKYTALGGARSRLGLPVDQSFRALDLPVATGSNSGGFQAQFRSGVITLSNDPAPVLTGVVQDEAQIFLVAIECQIKEEKVDEIYGSVGAIKTSSQESKVTHFPADGDPFEMGAEGQRVVSLQTPVYTGPFANVSLVCSLVEHDSGDIAKYKAEVADAISKLATMGGTALGVPSEAFGASSGFLNDISVGVSNALFSAIGADDDPFTPQALLINAADMQSAKMNALPKHHFKRADDPREFDFTHSMIVTGKDQGGDLGKYASYFDIKTRIIQEFA